MMRSCYSDSGQFQGSVCGKDGKVVVWSLFRNDCLQMRGLARVLSRAVCVSWCCQVES